MIPAAIALLAGLDAGLLLLGVIAPVTGGRLADIHGMALTIGFVGTLISLERATALKRWYGYFAPLLLGLGGVLLLIPAVPFPLAKAVLAVGAAAFVLIYIPLWQRQYDEALLTQLLAAGLALGGAIIWLGGAPMLQVLPWIFGFVVLTIAAERVELARITMGPTAGSRVLAHGWAITAASAVSLVLPDAGFVLLGLVLLSLTVWLVKHDVARRTIRAKGVTQYMAACILAGYVWLAAAAVLLLFGAPSNNQMYDAVVHAVMLGYTFSMIMAHATTILPSILAIRLPHNGFFWVPAIVLQVGVAVRLIGGDAAGVVIAKQIGGVLGVAALLLLLLTALVTAVVASRKQGSAK